MGLQLINPPEQLLNEVLHGVRREEARLKLRRTLFLLCIGLVASVTGFIFALLLLADGMWQSGFAPLASLLFTDTGIVFNNWQEFGYSLLETLPVTMTVAVLTLALLCLHLSRATLRGVRTFGQLKLARHSS